MPNLPVRDHPNKPLIEGVVRTGPRGDVVESRLGSVGRGSSSTAARSDDRTYELAIQREISREHPSFGPTALARAPRPALCDRRPGVLGCQIPSESRARPLAGSFARTIQRSDRRALWPVHPKRCERARSPVVQATEQRLPIAVRRDRPFRHQHAAGS
jgi:hypothetical protein